ncbi:MAG: GNAT family N-acetyltransferase [Synergistaceae bacterium]|nr:GNAT family N-acetyltransferase [Synergistaceae bacterium]
MSRVKIRPFGPGDASYVSYLHMKLYWERYQFKPVFEYYVMKGLMEFLRDPEGGQLWIAEADGAAVGAIAIVRARDDTAQLRWFLVDPPCQGTGIGRELLKTALVFCRERGYKHVFLWTVGLLETARRLYKTSGFTLAEEKTNDEWTDGVITEERWELVLSSE